AEDARSTEVIKPFLAGRDVKRYEMAQSNRFLLFIPWHFPLHKDNSITGASLKAEIEFEKQYPAIFGHLTKFKEDLGKRNTAETGVRYEWYALQRCAASYFEEFDKPKIMVPAIVNKATYGYDTSGMYSNDKTSIIPVNDFYLLGLLNSKAVDFVLRQISSSKRGGYFEYKPVYVSTLPIVSTPDPAIKEQIIDLVTRILAAKQADKDADTGVLEAEVDGLVYGLYGLTEEEVKIIES
ncbi:MAG: TaqI-like C-terminal specificity domain-containing protein, partial [Saprospiraceae bacterium]